MANISKPKSDNLPGLSQVPVPVSYSTLTGLALLLSDIIVSGKKVVPYVRIIPTSAFISGSYSFPTPNGYVAAPYQLPMLEPQSWNVVADIISAYQPVELYQIGNKSYVNDQGITVPADLMQNTFPINIYPGTYPSDAGAIKPLELNQSLIIRVYKNAGVAINWQGSNILNNGLTDAAIQAATELTFVVTNVLGKYQITEWLTPNFVLTDLSTLKTTAKGSLATIVNELYDNLGTGDVKGPNSSVDNQLALFSGTTGKLIKSSGVLLSALVQLTGAQTIVGAKTFSVAPKITAPLDSSLNDNTVITSAWVKSNAGGVKVKTLASSVTNISLEPNTIYVHQGGANSNIYASVFGLASGGIGAWARLITLSKVVIDDEASTTTGSRNKLIQSGEKVIDFYCFDHDYDRYGADVNLFDESV